MGEIQRELAEHGFGVAAEQLAKLGVEQPQDVVVIDGGHLLGRDDFTLEQFLEL